MGNPILGSDSYNQQLQKIAADKGAREAFNQIMSDVDKYGSQLDDYSSSNDVSFNALVASLVVQIGTVDKEMHYSRNKFNRAPDSLNKMIEINKGLPKEKQWKLLPPQQAMYHMNGKDGEFNLKFVSSDGHFEAVYNKDGILLTESNDPINMGTYNYCGPDNISGHTNFDVTPYFEWGNTAELGGDGSVYANAKAVSNLNNFLKNPAAIAYYTSINMLIN